MAIVIARDHNVQQHVQPASKQVFTHATSNKHAHCSACASVHLLFCRDVMNAIGACIRSSFQAEPVALHCLSTTILRSMLYVQHSTKNVYTQ
jgi:hypothetical protein